VVLLGEVIHGWRRGSVFRCIQLMRKEKGIYTAVSLGIAIWWKEISKFCRWSLYTFDFIVNPIRDEIRRKTSITEEASRQKNECLLLWSKWYVIN
jgi:hypothetical protein